MAARVLTDDVEARVAQRYSGGEFIHELAAAYGVSRKAIRNALRRQGCEARDKAQAGVHLGRRRRDRGERHPNRLLRRRNSDGYMVVSITVDDPLWSMATRRGSSWGDVLEHRLVMARALGRPLTSTETVHHLNDARDDNRIENLQLRHGRHGKGIALRCAECGSHNVVPVTLD